MLVNAGCRYFKGRIYIVGERAGVSKSEQVLSGRTRAGHHSMLSAAYTVQAWAVALSPLSCRADCHHMAAHANP